MERAKQWLSRHHSDINARLASVMFRIGVRDVVTHADSLLITGELMDCHSPTASRYRDGRLLVCHLGQDAIHTINRAIDEASRLAKDRNPSAAAFSPLSRMVTVQDKETRSVHLIHIHNLDHRSPRAPAVGNVVKFSEPAYAAFCTELLQLATPAFYRDQEDLKPGIGDRDDGALTKDATNWADKVIPGGAVTQAELTFVSSHEPWIFCAAHYRNNREFGRLSDHFASEYGYTAATGIADADAFATWLGIEFALGLDKTADVQLSGLDEMLYAATHYSTSLEEGSNSIETVVHVYHGPVHYADRSGRVDTQEHWFDPGAGPRAWFTKRRSFEPQSEYRFAVSTLGNPVDPKHYIVVSTELRALVYPI